MKLTQKLFLKISECSSMHMGMAKDLYVPALSMTVGT